MPITTLSGTLIRTGRNAWQWRDGSAEPCLRDLSPDEWNFRCTKFGSGQTCVEVLRGLAQQTDALAWVIAGWSAGKYRSSASGDHTGPRIIALSRDYSADGDESAQAGATTIRPGDDPLGGIGAPIRGPIPEVILVPIPEWDSWCRDNPSGCEWPADQEIRILAKAYALGWQPPAGWRSPQGWAP